MNHLERYARQQLAQLRLRLRSFYDTSDPEDLHQARLSLKRLRAVTSFVAISGFPCKDMETVMKRLRKDLRQLGEARNAFILIQRSRDIGESNNREFRKQLDKKYRKAMAGLPSRHSMEQMLLSAVLQLEEKGALCFEGAGKADPAKTLQSQLGLIRDSYHSARKDEDFHKLRRMLKETRYFLEFMPLAYRLSSFPGDLEDRLHELEELLGSWHDLVIMRDSVLDSGSGVPKEEQRIVARETESKAAAFMARFHEGMRQSGLLEVGTRESHR